MSIDPTVNTLLSSMLNTATGSRRRGQSYKTYNYGDEIPFPNVTLEPLAWGAEKNDFASHCAVVNNDDGRVITVVTDAYSILHHEDFLTTADEALRKVYGKDVQRSTRLINGGDKMLAVYTLEDNPITLRNGDIAYPSLILKNSYDLGWAAALSGGVFRLICSNGAYVGEMTSSKKKHTAQLDGDYVKFVTSNIVDRIPLIEQRMTEWAKDKIGRKTHINLDSLKLNDGEQQSLLYLKERSTGLRLDAKVIETSDGEKTVWTPEDETTKYDLWNLMTEFATHRISSPMRQDTISTSIDKLFHSNKLIAA